MHSPRLAAALLSLTALAYAWCGLAFMPMEGIWAHDDGVKLVQIESLLRSGFGALALDYPGRAIDPEGRFFPIALPFAFQKSGQFYSVFPVLFPLLSAGPYRVLGLCGLHVLPVLASIGVLFLVPWLCDVFAIRELKPVAPVLIGLGTPMFFYGILFWEHAPAAFLCTLALGVVLRSAREPQAAGHLAKTAGGAGAALGAAVWLRTEAYCFALAIALASLMLTGGRRERAVRLGALVLGFAAATCPLWLYNLDAFGSLMGAHVHCNIEFYAPPDWTLFARLARAVETGIRLLANPDIGDPVNIWIMTPFLAFLALNSLRPTRVHGALLCVCVALMALPSLLLARGRYLKEGLLAVTPVAAYAMLHVRLLWRRATDPTERILRFGLWTVVVYVVLVAAAAPVVGGIQHGPRFLLLVYPLVMLLALSGQDGARQGSFSAPGARFLAAGFLVLACCGLVTSIRVAHTAYARKRAGQEFVQKVRAYRPRIVVTDHWSTPLELAALYYEKTLFLVKEGQSLDALSDLLAESGAREFVLLSHEATRTGFAPRALGPARIREHTEEPMPHAGLVAAVYELRP